MSRYKNEGVHCPECGSFSRVIKTKPRGRYVRRWRQCTNEDCGHEFKTAEVIIVKKQKQSQTGNLNEARPAL